MRITILALVLAFSATPLTAQNAKRPFAPADWYKLTTISAPAISPDGQRVAFTVTTVKEADNKRHAEVWLVSAAGGEPLRLTAPSFESSNPRWSHDGKYLFFTSSRPGGKGNTWVLRMDQPMGEAFQLENYPTGSRPRSNAFVIFAEAVSDSAAADSADNAQRGRGSRMSRPPFGAITRPLDQRRFDGRHYVELPIKANDRGFLANRDSARLWRPTQLFMRTFGDTARKQLSNTSYSHRSVSVSPDGRWIAFVADARLRSDSVVEAERDSIARLPYDRERDEAERNDSDIFIVPVSGGSPRRLLELTGMEGNIAWSPDSRTIAFTNRRTRTTSNKLYTVNANGGQPAELLPGWRYEPQEVEWLPNGDLSVTASVGGRTALFRLAPKSKKLEEVISGRRRLSGFSYDAQGRRVAYVSTSVTAPTELYVADVNGRNERRLTSFNDALNAQIEWPDAERFTYTSVGGLEIEAWLMKPASYEAGKKYPLVLYIHGGPHSAYGENWFDEFHNIAGAGMFVLYTNPRGSSGYGADFTYATRGRWGMEDYEDLMKAVDIVAKRPDVDSTRMGVTGGSYGGFMTAWITTRTNRFKAAQTDRMISNWVSWYGASEAQGLTEFEFYGKPWDNWKLYDELSPLRYVDRVQTPTLIVQSEEDHRTPMADAEQWFMALKKRGVPVEFVRYPRSTHDLSRTGEPWLLVDRLGRLRQWFTHWLKPSSTVTAASPEQ